MEFLKYSKMKKITLYAAISFAVLSCEKSENTNAVEALDANQEINEVYTPKKVGKTIDAVYAGMDVKLLEIEDGKYLFDGDIVLEKEDFSLPGESLVSSRGGYTGNLWPARTIRWRYNKSVSNSTKNKWLGAIKEWQEKANFQFVEITDSTGDYILVKESYGGDNYSNSLGRKGGEQIIQINVFNSVTGNVIHEIGHAIGLVHEQKRADRDDLIVIKYDNIKPEYVSQFEVCSFCKTNGVFDFDSIMLYSSFLSLGVIDNTKPVMTRIDGTTWKAQRKILSVGDIEAVNHKYRFQK
jgi:Astacin (Peptidase family M12A)